MSEVLVGGALLSAALKVLFDRVASREFLSLFSERKRSEKLLERLKLTLLSLQSLLNDAEDKQITNKAVSDWLDELKDAFYHADDLVDEIATLALQAKLQTPSQRVANRVHNLISSSPFSSKEGITSRLKEMVEKLEQFVTLKETLGLKDNVQRKQFQLQVGDTSSLVDESDIFGRVNDREKIIELVFSDEASSSGMDVIPIVGMGGVGKTSLAQLVYNDSDVKANFDFKAWVCVSEEFDVRSITKQILVALQNSDQNLHQPNQDLREANLDLLQTTLQKNLKGKKFFLVLDDVWSDNQMHWKNLTKPFGDVAKQSKIIVTTRSKEVARVVGSVPAHQMEILGSEDSWKLFQKHAFQNGDYDVHPNLNLIGKSIVEKCKGLPLALVSLGGMLCGKLDAQEWENVLNSEMWELPGDGILPALRLSYYHLPSEIKRCFAYCSIFPKDYEFEEEELVRLWIAEDFVQQPKGSKSMEEECYRYFDELLSRSFFHHSTRNYGSGRTYSCIVMHDLVHDLAQSISGEFCFGLKEDGKIQDISKRSRVRYFSYLQEAHDASETLNVMHDIKFLRTFIAFDRHRLRTTTSESKFNVLLYNKILSNVLPSSVYLRVLSLSGYCISELPKSVGRLIHLRYLNLSDTHIKKLPSSITSLGNLRTLILLDCRFLKELPAKMEKLINLRHLDIRGAGLTEMPMQMSRLKSLQRLTDFVVGKDSGSRISELRELGHLRGELRISGLQNVIDSKEALEANMKEKRGIEKLVLIWGSAMWSERWNSPVSRESSNATDMEKEVDLILQNLQPPQNVSNLKICGYRGTEFPNWLGDDSYLNLVSISIEGCAWCRSLPSLGQLPFLKLLKICGMERITHVGQEFYGNISGNKPFQNLEDLSFTNMPEWEVWNFLEEGGEFSCLLHLSITKCPKLKGGLPRHVPCLATLRINECEELEGLEGLMTQQLRSLEELDISGLSKFAQMPPQLCRLTSLQKLKVQKCPNLTSFPDTVLPAMLRTLEIQECKDLRCLPKGMMRINTCLQHVIISNCPSLLSFPIGHLPATLNRLTIKNCRNLEFLVEKLCTAVEQLHIQCSFDDLKSLPLDSFPNLAYLYIIGCINLETFSCQNELQNLKRLYVRDCPKMVSFPAGGLAAPNLTKFELRSCENLKSLPHEMHMLLPSLQTLSILTCRALESFPEGGLPSNLCKLEISSCDKLQSLPERMHSGLVSLQSLQINWCAELESFPVGGLPSSLLSLRIENCPKLKWAPPPRQNVLASLQSLVICDCPELEPAPDCVLSSSSLLSLQIGPSRKLAQGWMAWNLQRLHCLKSFTLYSDSVTESFPGERLLPTTLTSLSLQHLPNLKSLDKGLLRLTALEDLDIRYCDSLLSLPEDGLPRSLSTLRLSECPLLIPHLQRKRGKYRSKIGHFPRIFLDHDEVFDGSDG